MDKSRYDAMFGFVLGLLAGLMVTAIMLTEVLL